MAKLRLLCPNCKGVLVLSGDANENTPLKCIHCDFRGIVSQFPPAPVKKVACPSCKTVLSVDANKTGAVECPKCKYGGDISAYLPPPSGPSAKARAKAFKPERTQDISSMGASASGHKLSRPASLVLLEGECLPKNVVLTAGMNTIGRKSPTSVCSIQLESGDTFMSRDHACIEFAVRADGMFEYRLSDNASSNGTFLNEKRVDRGEAMILSLNDRIRLGHTIFKFVIE